MWSDNNDNAGKRPSKVTIILYKDGKQYKTQDLTISNVNAGNASEWDYTFTNLPIYKDDGKTEINYTIDEKPVDDCYVKTVDGFTITNTYSVTSVSGSKTWDDAEDQDGKRPESITINLLADGTKVDSKTVTPDANGSWKWSFDHLAEYKNKKKIVYTITEDEVTGYTTEVNGYNVTNTYTPELTTISGAKTWDDNKDQDGLRPTSIHIQLLAGGNAVEGQSKDVTANDGWAWSFTNLPKYAGGQKITYTVEETQVAGYDAPTYDKAHLNVTNKHTPEKTSRSIKKEWKDSENQDGIRAKEVEIILNKKVGDKNSEVDTVKLNAENRWAASFGELPVYEKGLKIEYSFSEKNIDGYEITIAKDVKDETAYTATNKHTPETTTATVTKDWVDNDDNDNLRPTSVVVKLLANDTDTGKTVTLTSTDKWASKTLYKLDKYSGGVLINYTWEEVLPDELKAAYTPSYELTDKDTNTWKITNTHDDKLTKVTVTKRWIDADDQDGFRADEVTVHLLRDDKEIDKADLNEENSWTAVFDNLPVNVKGKTVTYSIKEGELTGKSKDKYEVKYSGLVGGKITVTNTHKPETVKLNAVKSFMGDELAKISEVDLQLYADGIEVGGGLRKLTTMSTKDDAGYYHWKSEELAAEWKDLPKYKQGVEIIYTVMETNNNNSAYKVLYNGETSDSASFDKDGTAKITNCEYIDLSGTKTWDDKGNEAARPSSITVILLRDGNEIGKSSEVKDPWTYSFTNLPRYDEGDGHEYVYTVKETAINGYDSTPSGMNITNKIQTTSISVNKNWDDNKNSAGQRPTKITVQLVQNVNNTNTNLGSGVELNEGNGWSYKWTGLPTYVGGAKATYTVTESAVDNYQQSSIDYSENSETNVKTATITNKYKPGTTSRTVNKTWDDQGNADGTRPAAITVRLYADGVQYRTATLTSLSGWTYLFTDLPIKDSNGNDISYTISEDAVAGYTTAISGMTVVNSHTPTTPPPTPTPPETPPTATTPPVDVLGARRTKTGSGSVLGARRSPQTGDTANAGIWAILMGASAALAAVWATLRKKLKGDDEQN